MGVSGSAAWWAASPQPRGYSGTLAPPFSTRQLPSPKARGDYTWRGVCERVRACGCVCVWMWRASRSAWGGGPRRGEGWAVSRGRGRGPARGSGRGYLVRGPVAAAGQIVIFVFPGRVPLPGQSSPAELGFEKEIGFQVSFTQRQCSLHLCFSFPFPNLSTFSFLCSKSSFGPLLFPPRGMISTWVFLSQSARLLASALGLVVSVNRGHSPTPERRKKAAAEKG